MNDRSPQLQSVLESGDPAAVAAFFHGMPEKERRSLFPVVRAFADPVFRQPFVQVSDTVSKSNPLTPAAEAAMLATANYKEFKRHGIGCANTEPGFSILLDRKPDWLGTWVNDLLKESYYWTSWSLVRGLTEHGLIGKPDHPNYYLGMISALGSHFREPRIYETLSASPDLLEHDIWKLFEYEGGGENSLANADRWTRSPEQSWGKVLLRLMHEGKLPRERLLDSSLAALERDFNHYRARWFLEFHDRLEPTSEERLGRADRYAGLLRASAPNVALWALEQVESLAGRNAYEALTLVRMLEPMLLARTSSTALRALKLLHSTAKKSPGVRRDAALTAAMALAHEKPPVQLAALALMDECASPDDREICDRAAEYGAGLAASVRAKADRWLRAGALPSGQLSAAEPDGEHRKEAPPEMPGEWEYLFSLADLRRNLELGTPAIPAARFDGTDIPRLTLVQKIAPIKDMEELFEISARVIEDGALTDDAERCFDGLSRLCGAPMDEIASLSGPLLKRVNKLLAKEWKPSLGRSPRTDLLYLLRAFCTGAPAECGDRQEVCSSGLLLPRTLALAQRIVTRQPRPLLSAPTHQHGWICPRKFVQRVNDWSFGEPEPCDLILSLLRLAPDGRAEALRTLAQRPEAWCRAVAYALGAEARPTDAGVPVQVAAARARSPWLDDAALAAAHPGLGPDAALAAGITVTFTSKTWSYLGAPRISHDAVVGITPGLPRRPDPLLLTVRIHQLKSMTDDWRGNAADGQGAARLAAVRLAASIRPGALDAFFGRAIAACFDNLDWWEARWHNRAWLEPLTDPATPLRPPAALFLAGMLSAKEPGESGLATDIAIRAIEDGRLGSDNLGAAMAQLIRSGMITPGRWQKTLTTAATSSPVHAAVIFLALQQCLTGDAGTMPKDVGKLLEILQELSLELRAPVTVPECREFLTGISGGGKTGKLAKALLAPHARNDSPAVWRGLLQSALAARVKAAGMCRGDSGDAGTSPVQ